MSCLDAALEYLRLGWSPLALCPPDHAGVWIRHTEHCGSPGKRPWHRWTECQKAPAPEGVIRRWWAKVPRSNVGVAYGPASGLVGIDVDGESGEAELAVMAGGDLPPTLEFTTGKGRRLLYAVEAGTPLRTTTHKTHGEHCELRLQATGAQTVMPPSVHPDGRVYRWAPGCGPDHRKAAPAPAWLLEALAPPPPPPAVPFKPPPIRAGAMSVRDRAARYLDKVPEAVTGQGGHDQTFKAARAVVYEFDLGVVEGFALLMERYNPRCRPPWSERELMRKCQQADTVPFGKPRGHLRDAERPMQVNRVCTNGAHVNGNGKHAGTPAEPKTPAPHRPPELWEPWEPFPLDLLPPPLAQLAREGAAAMECDPAYVAMPGLAALAGAIGNSRRLRLKRTWSEPAILWTVVVGDSGQVKSPAYELALTPLWREQDRWRDEHRRAMRDHEADLESHKDRCRQARDRGSARPDAPERPRQRRCVVQDVTVERLAELLQDNPRGLLVARDELAGWIGSFTRYKGAGGRDRPAQLAGTAPRRDGDRGPQG